MRFASFVNSEEDAFAAMLALKSLKEQCEPGERPILLASRQFVQEFSESTPDISLAEIYGELGGELILSFDEGFKDKVGMRMIFRDLANRLHDEPLFYFCPRTLFLSDDFSEFTRQKCSVAHAPDAGWPRKELYGPSLEEIWGAVAKLGDAKLEDWMDMTQPEGYWRRYPALHAHFAYTRKTASYARHFARAFQELRQDTPDALIGQGPHFEEASAFLALIRLGGKIVDPGWDEKLVTYDSFYELILRLRDDHHQFLVEKLLDDPTIRKALTQVDEYRGVFYKKYLNNIRGRLSASERDYGINRMNILVGKRNIRGKILFKMGA